MKQITALVSAICLLFSCFVCFAQKTHGVDIYLNGEAVAIGLLQQNRTLVPIRFLSEAMGYKVDWDEGAQRVTVTNGAVSNTLYIGDTVARRSVGDVTEEIIMDVAPMLIDSRTYVPLRYVAESLGCGVLWHGATGSVHLTEQAQLELNGISFSPVAFEEERALAQFGEPYDTIEGVDSVRRYVYFAPESGAMTVLGFYEAQLFEFFTNDTALVYNGAALRDFTAETTVSDAAHVFYDTIDENRPVALYLCVAGANYNAYTTDEAKPEMMWQEAKMTYYLTNSLRRMHGAEDLVYSEALAEVDKAHVADMSENNFFAHEGLNGDGINDRIADVPIYSKHALLGEVLAKMPNAYHAAYGWLNSPTHRECILNKSFNYTGICVDGKAEGNLYYAQVLVKLK